MTPIDLHFHSTMSDGTLLPGDVINRAIQRGAKLLALTDHDCTEGLSQGLQMAQQHQVGFLNGVEISVTWQKHTVHIIGLGIHPGTRVLEQGLERIRQGRMQRAQCMAAALTKAGILGTLEGAMSCCNNPAMIGRTHFARYLVQMRQAEDIKAVFHRFLIPGKPGYVPHQWATLEEAVHWIKQAGGLAVIAHPGRYSIGHTLLERLIIEFKSYGGEGIEVVSSSHSLDDEYKFALLADQYQLLASVGSDFHAPEEGKQDVGKTRDLPTFCHPVWKALTARIVGPAPG